MTDSKNLLEYIKSSFQSSEEFMSVMRGGIRYIYETEYKNICAFDKTTYNARLIGICAAGRFYSLSYDYKDADLDFMDELAKFEEKYNTVFEKQMKRYSADNLVGETLSQAAAKRLDQFLKSDLKKAANDIIFGNRNAVFQKIDHQKYEPLFLRHIMSDEMDLKEEVAADIIKQADELNYAIMSEYHAYRYAAQLLNMESVLTRVTIYGKIKKINHSQYRLTVSNGGKMLDNIYIDKERLLRTIKYNEIITSNTLTSTDRKRLEDQNINLSELVISFDDIIKIEYGQHIYYNKAA